MKFSKVYLMFLSLGVGSLLAACNGGSSNNSSQNSVQDMSLPITVNKNNNRPFYVQEKDDIGNTQSQRIRLMPLTDDQVRTANKIMAERATIQTPQKNYSIPNQSAGISGFPGNFWSSSPNLKPLNQQDFGACVTFSSSAALSYVTSNYTSTVNVSPLDILNFSTLTNPNNINNSGWDGLSDAGALLTTLGSGSFGFYNTYAMTNPYYISLSSQYAASGDTGNLQYVQLYALESYPPQINNYQALNGINGPFNYSFSGLSSAWAPLFTSISANNATLVVDALKSGAAVLLDFNLYDSSVSAQSDACNNGQVQTIGTMTYQYDSNTGQIIQNNSNKATSNNAWVNATGCLIGGHQVWVVGYAQAANGGYIFVIRNSWGGSGDSGQYYMTDDYINNAASYAASFGATATP